MTIDKKRKRAVRRAAAAGGRTYQSTHNLDRHDGAGQHPHVEEAAAIIQAIEGLKRLRAAGESIRCELLARVYHGIDYLVWPSAGWGRARLLFRATYQKVSGAELDEVGRLADAEALEEPNVVEDAFEDLDEPARARFRAAIRRLDAGLGPDPDPAVPNGNWEIVKSLRPVPLAILRHEVGLAEPGASRPAFRLLSPEEALTRRAARFDRARKQRAERGDTAREDDELMQAALGVLAALQG